MTNSLSLGTGKNENGEISKTGLESLMVSFWSHNMKELICLGIFIKFNWVFLTTQCKKKLEDCSNIAVRYGFKASEDHIPDNMHNDRGKELDTLSKFSILFVSNPTIQ